MSEWFGEGRHKYSPLIFLLPTALIQLIMPVNIPSSLRWGFKVETIAYYISVVKFGWKEGNMKTQRLKTQSWVRKNASNPPPRSRIKRFLGLHYMYIRPSADYWQ